MVVDLVGEAPAGLEVPLRVAPQPLDRPVGLRVGRLAEAPVDPQLPAERGERVGRPTGVAVDARLPIPEQPLRQAAQALQTPAPRSLPAILCLAPEDQHPGARPAEAQARDDNPSASRLSVPDGDLGGGYQTSNWQISPGR